MTSRRCERQSRMSGCVFSGVPLCVPTGATHVRRVEERDVSSIVYRTDPKNGAKYAYRSESYRDPVTRKPRNRKEYLGRVDPVTGEIIPKRSRTTQAPQDRDAAPIVAGDVPTTDDGSVDALRAELASVRAELASVRAERDTLAEALARIASGIEAALADIGDASAGLDART